MLPVWYKAEFSSTPEELEVNLWDCIGFIVPPKRLKVVYSTTK